MHITVDHTALQNILELAARISTKHQTLPVLQCVFLEVKNGTLTIRATNLEIGVESTISVQEKEAGVATVSAATLLQTISLINQKEVTLKKEGEVLVVTTRASTSSINTVPSEDFPHIPHVESGGQTLQGKTFALGIKTAAFAASVSSIKPELGSVYIFQKKEQSLTFVATDSFRLVEKTVPQQGVVFEQGILIPYKNALELARVCELQEENPTLLINENQCALRFKDVYITSRLVSGTFPDYEQIIPKEYKAHATLLSADLASALKKTNIFLNKFMQLTLTLKKNSLDLVSKGDLGTTNETIRVSNEGEDITLSFNQRYIQEVLPYIPDESITIHFAGVGRPIVIEGVHERTLRYLVMPMNK